MDMTYVSFSRSNFGGLIKVSFYIQNILPDCRTYNINFGNSFIFPITQRKKKIQENFNFLNETNEKVRPFGREGFFKRAFPIEF